MAEISTILDHLDVIWGESCHGYSLHLELQFTAAHTIVTNTISHGGQHLLNSRAFSTHKRIVGEINIRWHLFRAVDTTFVGIKLSELADFLQTFLFLQLKSYIILKC
jgi:hypothetical protein